MPEKSQFLPGKHKIHQVSRTDAGKENTIFGSNITKKEKKLHSFFLPQNNVYNHLKKKWFPVFKILPLGQEKVTH